MNTLSIVIPCYNHGRYLLDCIVSLFGGYSKYCETLGLCEGQDRQDFEVILVDDGSSDQSWKEIVTITASGRNMGRMITAVRLGAHYGAPTALNAGIRKATGQYVAIIHADDMVEPWHVSSLLDHVKSDIFCYGDIRVVRGATRLNTMRFKDWNIEKARTMNMAHAAICFPRIAFEKVQYPEFMKQGREDWAFAQRLACAGFTGTHIDGDPSYLYRREGQGQSTNNHTPEHTKMFEEQMRIAVPEAYQ